MRITIINNDKKDRSLVREELEKFVTQLADGTYQKNFASDYKKEVCFAAEWCKSGGEEKATAINPLVLLSLDNLRDLETVAEYKKLAALQPYTMLCFMGHDGHSLHIVSPYTVANPDAKAAGRILESNDKGQRSEFKDQSLHNAFHKLHYIYSTQLQTPLVAQEPTLQTCCKVSYDPEPYYNPDALAVTVTDQPEESPEYRSMQEDISDYNYPEEIPGLSVRDSRMRRFHDCLDNAVEKHHTIKDEGLFAMAVVEKLADGCHLMGLPEAWSARVAKFIPMIGEHLAAETIDSVFQTAYLRNTLKAIPTKFTRHSALLTFKTEAYMKEHYTLRRNVMTGVAEFRTNATGHGFRPLDVAARNTMTIRALKAGVDSWDRDLDRYINSSLIPLYYPMQDFISHLPAWDGHDHVADLARRVHTDDPCWAEDFHKWLLSMVAQWIGKDRQHGNAIVPLLIGPQGSGKTTFCRRLLPDWMQTYYSDHIKMNNDNDIFLAMSGYALINIDEFDAMKKSQQPLLKYLLSKHDVKFRPPYGKTLEERQRYASFIATTNNVRPLTDRTGSRRFLCVYADTIDNTGHISHSQLFAQLRQELEEGRRYWFDEEETARIISQNNRYQQVHDYQQMISILFHPAVDTPEDTPWMSMPVIMQQMADAFPTFEIKKNTDSELGKKLTAMGYAKKKLNNGKAYRLKNI